MANRIVHTLLGIEARTVVLVDTALASPFDYIAQVLMLTLVAILRLTINLALNHIPAKAIAPLIADNLAKNDSSKPSTSICHAYN
jgi:hypothetical protein